MISERSDMLLGNYFVFYSYATTTSSQCCYIILCTFIILAFLLAILFWKEIISISCTVAIQEKFTGFGVGVKIPSEKSLWPTRSWIFLQWTNLKYKHKQILLETFQRCLFLRERLQSNLRWRHFSGVLSCLFTSDTFITICLFNSRKTTILVQWLSSSYCYSFLARIGTWWPFTPWHHFTIRFRSWIKEK